MTSLSEKTINNSLTRANSAEIAGFALPSEEYEELTLGTSGTEYIAPANGYFAFSGRLSTSGMEFILTNTESGLGNYTRTSANSQFTGVFLPALKGQKITMFRGVGSDWVARFVYAEGEL